jgi:iron complex outermembrane receptor protein
MKTLVFFRCACVAMRFGSSALVVAASFPVLAQSSTSPVLPAVTVSAYRYLQDEYSAPYATTVLTSEQILASGATDANDAIRRLLGVPYRTDLRGGRDYSLDLRGFGATADQNVVVVVDGVRISENELATSRLSAIAPDLIESIEVVRGGSSVQWGEGASAGVINVVLKQGAGKGVHGSVAAQIESFSGRDVHAQFRVGGELADFDANLRSYRSDGYRDNSNNSQTVGAVGFTGQSGALKFRLRLNQEEQENRFPGSLGFAQFASDPTQTVTPNDFGNSRETRWAGGVEYRTGSLLSALDIGTRRRDTSSHYTGFDSETNVHSTQLSPKLTYSAKPGSSALTLQLGADVQRWDYDAVSNFGQNEVASQSNNALYASGDVLLGSQIRLVAGLRREQVRKIGHDPANFVAYDRSDTLNAWNLGVNQAVSGNLNLYGRLAQAYRLPNVDENRYLMAALRAQVTHDAELGVKWHPAGGVQGSARVFQQNAVDEIAYDPLTFSNVNLEPTRRSGFEVEGQAVLAPLWMLNGTLQTVKARFSAGSTAGLEIPLVSALSGTLRLSWKPDAHQSLNVGLRYLGEARFGDDNSNTCAAKIPASTLLDARYAYQVAHWEWSLAATNLANSSTYSQAFSCVNGALYPDPGRRLSLLAKYSY